MTQLIYLVSSLRTGGAQTGLQRIAQELDQDKYELTIVTINAGIENPQEWAPPDIDVIDLRIRRAYQLHRIRHLWSELDGADALICSLMEASLVGRVVGGLRLQPCIIDWRHNTTFQNKTKRLLFNLTAWIPDVILADSRHVQRVITAEPGTFSTPVRYVPIAGIDLDVYRPPDQPTALGPVTVISIMRLSEQKNPWAMIELANRFSGDDDVEFEVVGDGPLRRELTARIREDKLRNIRFLGYVEDVPSFLKKGDIYVQPSKSEGLCITVPEAMACELPVVASAVGGIPESVVDGETGYLLQPDDLDGFEERIRYLINHPDKRDEFGAKGRIRVGQYYSIDQLMSAFEEILSNCI